MDRRIIQLVRSIISVQLPYLSIATSRLVATTTMLRVGPITLLHRRAISRSLLHEPASLNTEPDDTSKRQK
jgi:hypothetical protein